ncbi:MAG: tetratricopeptide repeat protein, partial [Candidatus Eisenbacteria bacterium]|nr:tetratricopeptide repeat protein [Candidatus Eisenbacteria bacterium]
WLDALSRHLQTRTCLLVLDGCDRVLGTCASLASALLRSCPGLRVLTTSREALGIPGETVFPLSTMGVPPDAGLTIDELRAFESAELLIDRASVAHPGFRVTDDNIGSIVEICRQLEGIPLAIELAAVRVRSMTLGQIAERLDQRFRVLGGRSRGTLPHHQTLRALIDWSHDLLDPDEQTILRHLAVFSGGFSLQAAETVCKESAGLDEWDVLDLLSRLHDKSLVEVEASHRGGGTLRYSTLETVRQYAEDHLQAHGEHELARAAHRRYFVALAEDARRHLRGVDQSRWFALLDAELDNFRAALESCRATEDEYDTGLQLTSALEIFWHLRGYWTEGRESCERFLSLTEGGSTTYRARALKTASLLATEHGDYDRARAYLTESLSINEPSGNELAVAWSLVGFGDISLRLRQLDDATAQFERALSVFRACDDPAGLAITLQNLGIVSGRKGDRETSRRRYEESLGFHERSGNQLGRANVLNNLGSFAREEGDLDAAARLYSESLVLQRQLGNRFGIAVSLNNLGVVSVQRGLSAAARRYYEEALGVFRELGHKAAVAQVLHNLGDLAREGEDPTAARKLYVDAISLMRELGDETGPLSTLLGLARIATDIGEWRQACYLLGTATSLGERRGIEFSSDDRALAGAVEVSIVAALGSETVASLRAEVAVLGLDDAIRVGLGSDRER